MLPSAYRAPGVFGGQALPCSEFLIVALKRKQNVDFFFECLKFLKKVYSNSNHSLFSELPSASLLLLLILLLKKIGNASSGEGD